MGVQKTTLGFVPGEVAAGAHCMFVYPSRNETFYERPAGYVKAGLDAGEMCVCACPQSRLLATSLLRNGVDADAARATGQLEIHEARDVYPTQHGFDADRALRLWSERVEQAYRKWPGIRVFGDTDCPLDNRAVRLKMLEYESRVNLLLSRVSITLCGYQSGRVSRSLMLQMKSVHPFIATTRGIQHNHGYLEPSRFLRAFYRFQRISRVYAPTSEDEQQCLHQFEEIALRTPMAIGDLDEMRSALGEAFDRASGRCSQDPRALRRYIHVLFLSKAMGFTIQVRDHLNGAAVVTLHKEYPEIPIS